ncbi:MAG: hypothetical protein NT069_35655 [Planctomycetota bacterium]|nr:hypothetical protein [Planctomycetota bacterium]
MDTSGREELITGAVRRERVFLGGLLAGVTMFALVAISIRSGADRPPPNVIVLVFACVVGGTQAVLSFVLPPISINRQRRKLAESPSGASDAELLRVHNLSVILSGAMLEGAMFLSLVCFLVSGEWWLLLLVAVLAGLMLRTWPTASRLDTWLDEQRDLIERTF